MKSGKILSKIGKKTNIAKVLRLGFPCSNKNKLVDQTDTASKVHKKKLIIIQYKPLVPLRTCSCGDN